MKRFLIALMALLLLLSAAENAFAAKESDEALLTVTVDGVSYRLGRSTARDFAANGWRYTVESDGTYSFYSPENESYFYVRTQNGAAGDPVTEINLLWADGVQASYNGFPADGDRADGLSLWDWLTASYGAKENDEGTLTAQIALAGGILTVTTPDTRVYLAWAPAASPAASAAAGDQAVRRTIRYPGQDISIAVPAQYMAFYRDNVGLTISLGDENKTAYTRVQILPDDPAFTEEDYFENTWLPWLRSIYNSQYENRLLDEGEMKTYTVGGREMLGRPYTIRISKTQACGLVLFDRWMGHVIRYEAYYHKDDPDGALSLLSAIVRSVNKSALAPAASKQTLKQIDCAQQRFSFSAKPSYPWKYAAGEGVTVYTAKQGVIPYIMVFQSNNLIVETYEYLKEQYTPHVKEQYGKDLLSSTEYERFLIGGKALPAGVYYYRVQGKTVVMVRIYDSTGGGTAVYTAKFLSGEGDETMAALDAAVSTFQSTIQKKK